MPAGLELWVLQGCGLTRLRRPPLERRIYDIHSVSEGVAKKQAMQLFFRLNQKDCTEKYYGSRERDQMVSKFYGCHMLMNPKRMWLTSPGSSPQLGLAWLR